VRFLGRLILIPLAIAIAAFCALLFLGIVGMTRPEIAQAIAETAYRTMDELFRTALAGEEAIRSYAQNFVLFSRFVVVVLIAPVALTAVVAEVLGFRAYLFHALLAALLTAAMPFALLPDLIRGFPYASPATGLLAAAGALAGTIYWMLAGRGAGADPLTVEDRATMPAPRVRRG
jgi:hypothetical protein